MQKNYWFKKKGACFCNRTPFIILFTFTNKALLPRITETEVPKIKNRKCGMITIHCANISDSDEISK